MLDLDCKELKMCREDIMLDGNALKKYASARVT